MIHQCSTTYAYNVCMHVLETALFWVPNRETNAAVTLEFCRPPAFLTRERVGLYDDRCKIIFGSPSVLGALTKFINSRDWVFSGNKKSVNRCNRCTFRGMLTVVFLFNLYW